jgi:hypothetical protein
MPEAKWLLALTTTPENENLAEMQTRPTVETKKRPAEIEVGGNSIFAGLSEP